MSTALTKYEARVETPQVYQPDVIDLPSMMALADKLVPTGFLPEHIKNPGQALAIMLTGRELGMGPMRALRSLAMVKGKVVESADSQLARFKTDGGRAVFKELTDARAELHLRHPNGDEHVEVFTIEDARRAGLNGDNWRKYPKAMLRSRVITAGLKSIGWEGGAGAYDPEEAAAFGPIVTNGAAEVTEAVRDLTPDEAADMLVGFGKQKNLRLGDISDTGLHKIAKWIQDKQAEKGDDSFFRDRLDAIAVVLGAREAEAEVEQAQSVEEVIADAEKEGSELPFD